MGSVADSVAAPAADCTDGCGAEGSGIDIEPASGVATMSSCSVGDGAAGEASAATAVAVCSLNELEDNWWSGASAGAETAAVCAADA